MQSQNNDSLHPPESARRVYTVSEITRDIKLVLENAFSEAWVEGEASNINDHPSGHLYFSLKDKGAVLPAAIFNYRNKDIKFKVENGLKVICFGKIDVYPPHGSYKLIVEKIEPKGIGSLQLALEQLKEKLEKEGLFAQGHKRPLPYLPAKIGVVTSLSGAAIKDILKVLGRRFGEIEVVINPAQVQGDAAKEEIAAAIKDFNCFNAGLPARGRIELLIVGRGGGSIEDLWAFNEEIVARAIYASAIPVISAVGHERDWTIADLVADVRAATPSQAAEMAVPEKEELSRKIEGLLDNLSLAISRALADKEEALRANLGKLRLLNPLVRLDNYREKISGFADQIIVRMRHFLKLRQASLQEAASQLNSLSPLNILGRGYSITFGLPEGRVIKDAALAKTGDLIKTRLHKGEIVSFVREVNKNGGSQI
ncbi:MAG: exodeoxyribonuclease VII large subunit [Candidatus Omnitrophota bacterium]|nr:exodeoxyribonuclease VII large subunit [Candidatus Omnitrophota bacterium]